MTGMTNVVVGVDGSGCSRVTDRRVVLAVVVEHAYCPVLVVR